MKNLLLKEGPISLWTCYVSLELATTGLKRSHARCLCHTAFLLNPKTSISIIVSHACCVPSVGSPSL